MGHQRFRHHLQPAVGTDAEVLPAFRRAVVHLENAARTWGREEECRLTLDRDLRLQAIAGENARGGVHDLHEERVRVGVPVRLAEMIRSAKRLPREHGSTVVTLCRPQGKMAGKG